MKKRIYLSLLAMGLVCIAVTSIMYGIIFWKTTQQQAETELSSAVTMLAVGMNRDVDPTAYLSQTAKDERGLMRITWINWDGTILFESDADAGTMENHLERPEVQQAFAKGTGKAVRQSATISKALYYAAHKLPNGTILRVSIERDNAFAHLVNLVPLILLLLFIACICCIKASRTLTASLLSPLRKTARVMENIGSSNESMPKEMPHVYSELRPMVQKILDQSSYINETIQTLERERNTVRLVMEHLEEGVILTDIHRNIVVVNSRACTILQVRKNVEITGLSLDQLLPELDWHSPQDSPAPSEAIQRLVKDETLYRIISQPIYKDDVLYGALFIFYDITEIERREQLRREFTSNVSHELKTPLTSISGFAEMIAAGLYEKPEEIRNFGTRIRQESQRLLGLIDNIIHLTRIEEVRDQESWRDVSLKSIIEDIVSFLEPVSRDKDITVHMDLDDIALYGDAARLREMAMNIIDNAVKYNLPGGHVYISLKEVQRELILTVQDTGIGIPEEKQKRVFERFYRVDESRSKQKGSGLGLSIVKHIVEQHHGRITLSSKAGEGTTVVVKWKREI